MAREWAFGYVGIWGQWGNSAKGRGFRVVVREWAKGTTVRNGGRGEGKRDAREGKRRREGGALLLVEGRSHE